MPSTFIKDSAATLDYKVDWSDWLGTDTITNVAWILPTGLTLDADTHTTTTATAWISGGVDGTDYTVTNHVTTAGGRTDERTIKLYVRQR